ncbi:N-acetyl-gamma-glutamyl-phosphate reductase [Ekhidna sp.]
MEKIRVGIIGAAGYTAGDLLRILIHHPNVEIVTLQSQSQAGKKVSTVHTDLIGDSEFAFSATIKSDDLDVVFLCKGHGKSLRLIESSPDLLNIKVIDLSQDYRLQGNHDFVYGLPEINRAQIKSATHIANPGCFATGIQLGILPAIKASFIDGDIHVSGITGSTGAGQSFSTTSHFSWRTNNASVYKPFVHQHLNEIGESCVLLDDQWNGRINFVPYRGAFSRGIITTSYFATEVSDEDLRVAYEEAYESHPFTYVSDHNPDLKMVVNTNKAIVYPKVIGGQGMVISVIDNLLKGASGQAVQNMNLLFNLDEKTGLNLKASAF